MKKHLLNLIPILLLSTMASGQDEGDSYRPIFQAFTEDNHFEDSVWFNWGGSIIQGDDQLYYLFYSRWPRQYGFLAWLTHSEIAVASSGSPTGPWNYEYTALKGRRGDFWDAVTAHNPKIKRFGGTYYLYYSSTRSTLNEEQLLSAARGGYQHKYWAGLRNMQRTGVAVSDKIGGPWKRTDQPMVEPIEPLHTITVNPAVTSMPDGRYLLMVKGDKFPEKGSPRIQAVGIGETPSGPFEIQAKPAITDFDTEDASVWYDQTRRRFYACFHGHTHFGMITSTDGISWNKARQYLFSPKGFKSATGATFTAERMERPSVFTNDQGLPLVFISSYRKGNTTGIFTIPMIETE
ncbi:MAG: glycoside hydrolase family protein [Bacteroidota bacterium]|nr:glycoside hydrolase family protein [Bacteroidota bacterium]